MPPEFHGSLIFTSWFPFFISNMMKSVVVVVSTWRGQGFDWLILRVMDAYWSLSALDTSTWCHMSVYKFASGQMSSLRLCGQDWGWWLKLDILYEKVCNASRFCSFHIQISLEAGVSPVFFRERGEFKRKEKKLLCIIVELNGFGRSFRHDMTCQEWRRQDQRRQTVLV